MYQGPSYQAARKDVDRLVDGMGMGIDDGVKDAVAGFRAAGFETTMSCEGHAERALSYPWIDFGIQKPPVKDNSIHAPDVVKKLAETLTQFSKDFPGTYLHGFASNDSDVVPAFRYMIMKKNAAFIARNLDLDRFSPAEEEKLLTQVQKMIANLKAYYIAHKVAYELIFDLDVRPDGSFRLEPVCADYNGHLSKAELEPRLTKQRQELLKFAEFCFKRAQIA